MDYGKYSYIKLSEQDNLISSEYSKMNSAIEFSHPLLNRTVNNSYVLDVGSVKMQGKMYIQNNITFSSSQSGRVLVELLLDGIAIESVSRQLSSGECSVLIMKTYNPSTLSTAQLSVSVKIETSGYSTSIVSNFMAVWGAVVDTKQALQSTMRKIEDENDVIVSFIEDGKIYYASISKTEQTISKSQFAYLTTGLSHCFAKDKHGNLFLFRVDANQNLYYCNMNNMASEVLLDTQVSSVYASACPQGVAEEMLICYIQNEQPYYRTYLNQTMSSKCSFDAPNQKYADIYIADSINNTRMYVVCRTTLENNYIFISQQDGLLTGFAESINVDCQIEINRYTNLNNFINALSESVAVDGLFGLQKHYLAYQTLFNSGLVENINAQAELFLTAYEKSQIQEYLYTIEFDQINTYNAQSKRVSYGEDALLWNGVAPTFDATTHLATFVDSSGLAQKWPFCEIKPCLVQNGELVGYLNPNNYAQFEDGTPADITSGDYDVMVQFPKIYWKLEEDWDGTTNTLLTTKAKVKVSISNTLREGFVCQSHTKAGEEYDYIYVGAYESHIENGRLYCCSGKLPTSDINHIDVLNNWSTIKGGTYTTLNYHFITYLQILSLLYFQEYYGCDFLGYGWTSATASNVETSGQLNTAGMFYSSNDATYSATEVHYHNKLFGLENIWGHSKTYVDGILETEQKALLIIDNTQSSAQLNLRGTGYKSFSGILPTTNWTTSTWVGLFKANNEYGFFPMHGATTAAYMAYNQHRISNYKPSGYRYFTVNSDCPYMIFTFGGDGKKHCGFSMFADRDFRTNSAGDNKYHNERIMCYPASKKSR